MAQRINAPEKNLPTFFSSDQTERPHVEVNTQGYHLVVFERGEELSRRSATSLRDLLFWIFSDTTFSMACEWEIQNREDNKDFRRKLFSRQLELMKEIDPEFSARLESEIRIILQEYPFTDNGA